MSDMTGHAGESFVAYLKDRLPLIERALHEADAVAMSRDDAPTDDLDRYLYAPLAHFTAGGGKRVRPVLALLGAEAVGGCADQALSCGVAIELFQSAALIHDDIADASELRRGEPCLYRTEGLGLAINAGDLALTRVFEIVLADGSLPAERRLRVLEELVRMERHTLEGQALDLGWARDGRWDVTSDDYLYMIDGKTAWYTVASPLYAGALAAGAEPDAVRGLIEVGLPAGLLPTARRPAEPGGRCRRTGQGLPQRHHGGQAHPRGGLGARASRRRGAPGACRAAGIRHDRHLRTCSSRRAHRAGRRH